MGNPSFLILGETRRQTKSRSAATLCWWAITRWNR